MWCQLLPTSLVLLLGYLATPVWSAASLIPPSSFPDPPSSTPTLSGSATGSQSASLTGSASISQPTGSASVNTSSAATPTTTQFPPLSDVPTCVTNSLQTAVSRVQCDSITQVDCYCSNPNFPAELLACIQAFCPDQLSAAEDLAQKFCNVAAVSHSLSFAPVPTSSPTSDTVSPSSSTSLPSTTPSTTPSSAAMRSIYKVGGGAILAATGTAIGLALGASLVL
ncbi:hypothetical protein D9619_002129 [Psilocybe cf. subviscida]|uniref:CFEM domain-containing protein n=1 Tax=Psilocybe cf. subviscida TaxID=2480587 RepID=A0A8H5F359_9AGAR|nr:hypothetical protein D9619_002129 [Psilocybe cf. subviscida]